MKVLHDMMSTTRKYYDKLKLLRHVMRFPLVRIEGRQPFILLTSAILVLSMLTACGPSAEELEAVDYTPLPGDDWRVSTPAEQGLDPMLLAEFYHDAAELETIYGLLVIKNGYLISEGYFNQGSVEQISSRQSITKSITSALVGIALDRGCLSSVDQRMMEFFPDYADKIADPRKEQITIRHLLQMRAGFPDEELVPPYLDLLYFVDDWHWIAHIVDFPLVSDPGTAFNYSNLVSHILGMIVARACDTDLESFAQENLFTPIDAQVGDWYADGDNYNFGCIGIFLTARDMAKVGMLYLHYGEYEGTQVLSSDWVRDSVQRYDRQFKYASGHGGNYIIMIDELDMIIVTTADPLEGPELAAGGGWKYEGAINRLVGKFIESLPSR
jgi:CubicO group peptidase (beta-lactamase class C family)